MSSKTGYGHFGNLSAQYARARQEFPAEVVDYLWSKLTVMRPRILDVGCGTGIPTRQMAFRGSIIVGSDTDPEMITRARSQAPPNTEYITAATENLPFSVNYFDAVTAFSAFHWFANSFAINEIKRVLKSGGIFFVANKNDKGHFKYNYRKVLKQFIAEELPDIKKNYEPGKLLDMAGFHDIETRLFPTTERFAVDQAVLYLQSVSLWNLVSKDRQSEALDAINNFCIQSVASDGFVHRELEIITYLGLK